MGKRGVTQHIEMIIATVLFIAFFFFIFVFVKPYDTDVLSESLVDGLKYSLDEIVEVEVINLFISVKEQPDDIGFSFSLPTHISDELNNPEDTNCKAFNLNGESYQCYVKNKEKIYIKSENKGDYNILFSSEIESSDEFSSNDLPEIKIGGDFNQEVYSYNLLLNLSKEYEENYSLLKSNLGFPESYDFAITSEVINLTRNVPQDVEVLGREFIKEIMFPNGTIINERFLIRIW